MSHGLFKLCDLDAARTRLRRCDAEPESGAKPDLWIFQEPPISGFVTSRRMRAASAGTVLAPAKSIAEMERVAFNNYICGTLTVLFVALVLVMAYFTLRMSLKAFRNAMPSAAETPPAIREGGLSGAPA